jgi:hypothetical protein
VYCVLLLGVCSQGLQPARKQLAVQEDPEYHYLKETMNCGQGAAVDVMLHSIALQILLETRLLIFSCGVSGMCRA